MLDENNIKYQNQICDNLLIQILHEMIETWKMIQTLKFKNLQVMPNNSNVNRTKSDEYIGRVFP